MIFETLYAQSWWLCTLHDHEIAWTHICAYHFDLRYRGFVEDGFNETTPEKFNTIRGTQFWQVVTARLAFVIVFEVRVLTSSSFIEYLHNVQNHLIKFTLILSHLPCSMSSLWLLLLLHSSFRMFLKVLRMRFSVRSCLPLRPSMPGWVTSSSLTLSLTGFSHLRAKWLEWAPKNSPNIVYCICICGNLCWIKILPTFVLQKFWWKFFYQCSKGRHILYAIIYTGHKN